MFSVLGFWSHAFDRHLTFPIVKEKTYLPPCLWEIKEKNISNCQWQKKNVKPSTSLFQKIKLNVLNEFRIKSDMRVS